MEGLIWVVAAILCNATAQLTLKAGAVADLRWQIFLTPSLLTGVVLYGISFLLTIKIYAKYPLSVISPLMAGAIFMLVSLGSALFFSEPVTLQKTIGIVLILAGIGVLAGTA